MNLQLEAYYIEAKKSVAAAKTAAAAYKATSDKSQLSAVDAAPGYINTLLGLAKKEKTSCAESWSDLEAWKPKVDAKCLKEGTAIRTQIVDLTKGAATKLEKFVLLASEAETIKEGAAAAAGAEDASPQEVLVRVNAWCKRVNDMNDVLESREIPIDSIPKAAQAAKNLASLKAT